MEKVWGHSPVFSAAVFHFVQDGNTLGTTDETESIEIHVLTQLPGETPFVVVKTNGWSVDQDELQLLIDQCVERTKFDDEAD